MSRGNQQDSQPIDRQGVRLGLNAVRPCAFIAGTSPLVGCGRPGPRETG